MQKLTALFLLLAAGQGQAATQTVDCGRLLDVRAGENVDDTLAHARRLVQEVDSGQGVLVLTDAFGATPGNVATQLAEPDRVAVVAGVNLPMLLRAVCYRAGPLAELVAKAMAGGEQGIMQVGGATAVQNQANKRPGDDQQRLQNQQ